MKPIHFTNHARGRMVLRGATEDEVVNTIRSGARRDAKYGKQQARHTFDFEAISPMNGKWYANKTIEAVFADEENALVILSVKVYYH